MTMSVMSELVLEAIGVSKVYPGGVPVTALTDADLAVRPGEIVAVQGPSGSGKSTLLGLLGLLDVPTAGVVRVKDRDASGLGDAARSRLRASTFGFVFQQFNLIPHLTAEENVAAALLYRGLPLRERAVMAREVLGRVGLGHRAGHRPGELSGGEQQRVALARAVVAGPEVILADEPTGNLDSEATAAVLELLAGFVARGVAVVVATHDPEVASRAHRRLRMRDGLVSPAA
jgi:putative ABC transport system ATP-binding protein